MRFLRLRGATRLRRGLLAIATLALGSVPAFVAVNQAHAAAACQIGYVFASQWNTGFQTNLTITNLGDPITSWTLEWDFANGQTINNLWNGNATQVGTHVTVTNVGFNGSLGTGQSATPGFIGNLNGATTNAVPTTFKLNGTTCNGATPTPTPTATPTGNPTPTPSMTPTGTPTPTPTATPTGPPPAHPANPFPGSRPYLNPNYVAEIQAQAAADGSAAEARVATWQTAIWMDRKAAIAGDAAHMGLQAHLDRAAAQSTAGAPTLFEVVIYDLPGRDCAALASNGEIPATAAGLTDYETNYITPIATLLSNPKYSSLRIVAIVEPDSLPNAVTNVPGKPTCTTSAPFYEQGVEFALNKLHAIGNVWNFVDIAHSAWLGWPNNMSGAGQEFAKVARATTAQFASIDGFASDTANYTPTIEPFLPNPQLQVGGQQLMSSNYYQFNPTFDENTFTNLMWNTLVSNGFPNTMGFVIDTSRNGWGGSARPTALNSTPTTPDTYVAANKVDQRVFRGNWCNQNGAGIGAIPQANPAGVNAHIFAFVWVKPPGESDGDFPSGAHTHGDPHCDSASTNTDGNGHAFPTGSIPGFDIPAGQFFPFQFQQLVKNSFPVIQ
jgi:cellulose 1,4-beta-cellobiosidase